MKEKVRAIALLSVFLVSGCRGYEYQMESMEKFGFSQRDCVASTWFSKQRPDLFNPGSHLFDRGLTGSKLALRSADAYAECVATRRLVEEDRDEYGLFRRYRCKVSGQDVEMSLSAAGELDWCEYAYGGDQGLAHDKRYTEFRSQ